MVAGSSGYGQWVELVSMIAGSSGCDQCMGPVGVVSGCGQWVVDTLLIS